ncbi:MAG TPA: asparagine synthase (glutamine-hydrolyzing) [Candidatus Baltobacteraceae bacterium]|nr:asparagine synthase (glutamine-hydrolyzing) [Candidatus Baltobacteraceae bacterium]
MCGIAGIVSTSGFDPQVLVSMTDTAKHRGPDGSGVAYFDLHSSIPPECFHRNDALPSFENPGLGFGARRLAILDLSEMGNQPMQIEDGRLWIAYNGEIYNYVEIRAELESAGHRFRAGTDTEVILRAYREWGPSCVERFSGMWSFALYDRDRQALFCSRDRFGIKPFYYYATPSLLLFASEIKQILQHPGVERVVDEAVAFQYLAQGVQDHTDATFFRGIRQLPAGHSLHVDLSAPRIAVRLEKYWEMPIVEERAASEKGYVERFASLFDRAVRQHLRSDVPVGSCLSGGLDSSSIVAAAASADREMQLHSFSSCFDDPALDERPFIKEMVSSAGLAAHWIFPKAEGFWSDLSCLIWHQDEPVGGSSVYAQWCVMRAARKAGIPVLLDGQGGDEILCGYRKFYPFYLWHLLKRANARVLPEAASWAFGSGIRSWSSSHAKRYLRPRKGASLVIARTCTPEFADRTAGLARPQIGPGSSLAQRQKDDLMRYSLPALLHYEDRSSMAHSVESRVPMLDHELATFAVNCPPRWKLRNGSTKRILREAMKGTLSEQVRLRKTKLGFETPQRAWLREDACGTIRSVLQQRDFRMNRILSIARARDEFDAFFKGKPGSLTDIELFRVLNLELWSEVFAVS